MELYNFLDGEQKEIGVCLERLFGRTKEIVVARNNKIQNLIKQNEILTEERDKALSKKNKTKIRILGSKHYFIRYVKGLKKVNTLLKFYLKQQILLKDENKNLVKNDQLEAFKIVINDLEYKKDKIKEQALVIEQLQKNENDLKISLKNIQEEKSILQTQNTKNLELLSEKDVEINVLREQNKNFELLKVKYSDMENAVFQFKISNEEKDRDILRQNNTVETMIQELKEKNLKIVEIKNNFFEIFDEFNDILQRINQNE
ncbi:MAG: hypothetical protein LBG48_04470 [Rickettsiales bacterium]|jgi:hypothetical protein|nr:hypothetical protein [Rickettsiales bacterium]